jgi:hypothetical protein
MLSIFLVCVHVYLYHPLRGALAHMLVTGTARVWPPANGMSVCAPPPSTHCLSHTTLHCDSVLSFRDFLALLATLSSSPRTDLTLVPLFSTSHPPPFLQPLDRPRRSNVSWYGARFPTEIHTRDVMVHTLARLKLLHVCGE